MEVNVKLEMQNVLPESIAIGTAAMLSQREKGVEKYGQPIEEAKLSARELVEHAQQEMADGLVYTSMLGKRVAELEEDLNTAMLRLFFAMEAFKCATNKDLVFPSVVGAPAPSKREAQFKDALIEILYECRWGNLGEQVAKIRNIAQAPFEKAKSNAENSILGN